VSPKKHTIVMIAGARPNFMKLAPVYSALRGKPGIRSLVVHTGQHYDANLSDAIFRDLGARPRRSPGVGSGAASLQTGRIPSELDRLRRESPAVVLVFGDGTRRWLERCRVEPGAGRAREAGCSFD
jgi:UDP-N-acetylglucosamine 2-epimerase (non-hydrolysing)